MKLFIKQVVLGFAAAGLLSACANDDDYSSPAGECTNPGLTATKTIQEIIAVNPTTTPQLYTADDIIAAYVTSSDERGAFFKTVSLQTLPIDGSQPIGFSVAIDDAGLFTKGFKPGNKVYIKLKDLYTAKDFGSLKVGSFFQETGESPIVGRIPTNEYQSKVFVSTCESVSEEDLVKDLTITQAKSDARLNTLIELQNVQFKEASFGYSYYDEDAPTTSGNPQTIGGATNHFLEDAQGNTIVFRTSSFANFAGNQIPQGSGTVRGVLTKFLDTYQFVARYESDINLTGARLVEEVPAGVFYSEDFDDAVDNTDFNLPGWANLVETGSRKWSEQAFEGNGYAEFSSFGSGSAVNVAWLVTPAIDMNAHTNETLMFDTAQHHLDVDSEGNKLEVYILTSFNGTDINGATKVDITDMVALPTSDTEWYEFVNSGAIDLSSYTGTIYVAFKFTGSGTDTTLDGAFQIDNLVLSGN